jgi:hypothetical protein
VRGDVPVDSDALLVTDFVNLKIKPAQSFRGAHRNRMCMRVFIEVSACTCMSICVCTLFLKKKCYAQQESDVASVSVKRILLDSMH